VISMTYVSTAAEPFGDAEVRELLRHSRENNTRLGLTGMLLFKGDQFMQVLEGDDETVHALYAVIAADPRHTDVRTLLSTPITRRQFSEWSMGYQAVSDDSLREIPGYDGFLESAGRRRTWDDPTKAQWLLDWFRTHSV
jgi:hypothetical protein